MLRWSVEKLRIEIDSIQRAVGYQKLWAFILKKLEERFTERDYNRAIDLPRTVYPDIYLQLGYLLTKMTKPELDILKEEIGTSLEDFKGFLDNIGDDKKAIQVYLKEHINNSKSISAITSKIKELVYYEFKEENIKSFMESTF